MNNFKNIFDEWQKEMDALKNEPWRIKMNSGQVSIKEYKGYLRETYFHAGINPQVQAMATAFYSRDEKTIAKKFYKHASSEVAHDLLALNDLKHLGEDISKIPLEKPLPQTLALMAFPFYQIQFSNPVGYLGYLFHLEFLPTQNGTDYLTKLKNLGIPNSAVSFLKEHSDIDVEHNKYMEDYVRLLVKSPSDLEEVIYCAKVTCRLHSAMINASFENGLKIFS